MPGVSVIEVQGIEGLKGLLGQKIGPSGWREVTQEMIDEFAELSGDDQWIHVDVERAKTEPVRDHGRARQPHPVDDRRVPPRIDRLDRVQARRQLRMEPGALPAPVPSGSRIRATAEVTEVEDVGGGWWQVVTRFTVEVGGSDKPACVADSVGRALPVAAPPA